MARGVAKWSMTFEFNGVDNLTPKATKVKQSLNSMDSATQNFAKNTKNSFSQIAGAYNTLIVASRAARVIQGMIAPAVALDDALADLRATTGLMSEDMRKLEAAAIRAAGRTPFDPAEAIKGAKIVQMATGDVTKTVKALEATLGVAALGYEGNVEKAAILTRRLESLKSESLDLRQKLDGLVSVSRSVGVPINLLGEGMQKAALQGILAQTSFEDLIPVLAISMKNFDAAASAGTGFLTGLLRLADPKIRAGLAQTLGMKFEPGQVGGMQKFMVQLAESWDLNRDNLKDFQAAFDTVFGKRAMKAFLATLDRINTLAKEGADGMKDRAGVFGVINNKMAADQDALRLAMEQRMASLTGQTELLSDSFKALSAVTFAPLIKSLTNIVMWIKKGVDALVELQRKAMADPITQVLAQLIDTLVVTAGAFVAVGAAAVASKAIIVAAWGFVAKSAGALLTTTLGKVLVIMTGIAAIATTIAGFVTPDTAVQKTKEDVERDIQREQSKQQKALMKGLKQSVGGLTDATAALAKVTKEKLPVLPTKALQFFESNMGRVKKVLEQGGASTKLAEDAMSRIQKVMKEGATADIDDINEAIKATKLLSSVTNEFGAGSNKSKKMTDSLVQALTDFRDNSGLVGRFLIASGFQTDKASKELTDRHTEANKALMLSAQERSQVEQEIEQLRWQMLFTTKDAMAGVVDETIRLEARLDAVKTRLRGLTAEEIKSKDNLALFQKTMGMSLDQLFTAFDQAGSPRKGKLAGLKLKRLEEPKATPVVPAEPGVRLTSAITADQGMQTTANNTEQLKKSAERREKYLREMSKSLKMKSRTTRTPLVGHEHTELPVPKGTGVLGQTL